jgi:hypothetical protein
MYVGRRRLSKHYVLVSAIVATIVVIIGGTITNGMSLKMRVPLGIIIYMQP